jgi:hypothetical protein
MTEISVRLHKLADRIDTASNCGVTLHELGGDRKGVLRAIALAEHEINTMKRSLRDTWDVDENNTEK